MTKGPDTSFSSVCTKSGNWAFVYVCVRCIELVSVSTDFWSCSDSVVSFCFSFYIC